jgi:homoserine dehydrogenase
LGLLRETGHTLAGVTDSSGTVTGSVSGSDGVDRQRVIAAKEAGETLASALGGRPLSLAAALLEVDADVVVDTTATDFDRREWGETLDEYVVRRGRGLILAAKDAAASHVDRWSDPALDGRVGINAVLGGAGRQLLDSVGALRGDWIEAAFVGSASTTAIIEVLESGGSFEDGLAVADEQGFLESDPELDLKGVDAAVKLSVVKAALTGRPGDLVVAQDLRDVDPEAVRGRVGEGLTTRLVGEVRKGGVSTLTYKAVPKGSTLDVACDEVAYTYRLGSGEVCTHRGKGLGPGPTAEAVLVDLQARFPVGSGRPS